MSIIKILIGLFLISLILPSHFLLLGIAVSLKMIIYIILLALGIKLVIDGFQGV